MKRIITSIAAVAFSLFASPANAQIPVPTNQWIPAAQGVQGDIFSIDKGSIQLTGGVYGFWVHIDHATGNIAASRIFMAASCGADTIQYAWLVEANRNGQIVTNKQVNSPFMQAAVGTVNSQLINAVCTGFSTDPNLAALTRARQTSAEVINRAMNAGLYAR